MATQEQRGSLTLPDITQWETDISTQRAVLKLDDSPLGLVFYTDGGCRPTPRGNGGWGIFGYLYHTDAPKQGHGGKGFVPTAMGLLPTGEGSELTKSSDSPPVTVLQYLEARGGLMAPSTNNEAEAAALYHALRLVQHLGIKRVFFRLDSEYALGGIDGGAARWAKAGWRRGDGSMVPNHQWWRETLMLYSTLINNGVSFRFEWVKGHSDSMGNWYADFLATSGIFGTQNGHPDGIVRYYSPKGYWNHSPERHPFLTDPLWYLDPESSVHVGEHQLFFTGNHFGTADDSDAGVAKSKAFYAIAMLKSAPAYLNTVVDFLKKTGGRGVNHYVIGRLDALFGRLAHRELTEFGHRYISRPSESPNVIFGTQSALVRVSDPPLLIYRAMNQLEPLEGWLRAYVNKSLPSQARLTDLTDVLYETTQPNPKKPPVTKTLLKVGDKQYLDVVVNYCWKGEERTASLRLLIGTELPGRNFFASIDELSPKVYLITNPETFDVPGFRYRVVVETKDEFYIREASYSNLWFAA